jgi:hypothetical protein
MMTIPEIALQHDMFSGKLVDNRSRYQKRKDKTRSQPQQIGMFSLKDTVELGVSVRPWLKELPPTKLELEREDVRTDEEREQDLLREALSLTGAMFAVAEIPERVEEQVAEPQPQPQRVQIPVTIFPQPIVGCRKRLRHAKVRVRSRVL